MIGEVTLPVQIGPCTFKIEFQVMDVDPAYTMLLGRPWIHDAGAVPSTFHQKVKFVEGDRVITIEAEEHMMVNMVDTTPYIDHAEGSLEAAFQSLEIVEKEKPAAKESVNTIAAHIMARQGYQPGKGLGRELQGIRHHIEVIENPRKQGLGFEDKTDRQGADKKNKGKKLIPHIGETFPQAAETIHGGEIVAVIEKGEKGWTHPSISKEDPAKPLTNWKSEPIPFVGCK